MMVRLRRTALLLIGSLAPLACASDAPIDRYANATLTSGTALGDLVLGQTTLAEFERRVTPGRVIIVASDESAFEFAFHHNELAAQFRIVGACAQQIDATRDLSHAGAQFDAYLAAHPACRDLPLSSISVGTDRRGGSSFYRGATEHGVRLGDVITTTAEHGASVPAPGRMVAGLTPNAPENVLEFPGLLVYYDAGTSGKIEDTSIRRLTIFVAER